MPDEKSYPNKAIVMSVMGVIDKLCIDINEPDDSMKLLEDSPDVEANLTVYANGEQQDPPMGSIYKEAKTLAKSILAKINRVRHSVVTTYNADGDDDPEEEHIKYQSQIRSERAPLQGEPSKKRQKVNDIESIEEF